MWFLFLKIFFLMALAAALGAWLAWWWFRRNYEDVTTYHEELISRASRKDAIVPATKDDLNTSLADLRAVVSGIRVPDISPLNERLVRIEHAMAATGNIMPGLGQLNERFGKVETLLQQPDASIERIAERLAELESSILSVSNDVSRIQNTDLDPIESRLVQLEDSIRAQSIPETDLGPVHSGLARLELALENLDLPTADIEPLRAHLGAMETRLAEFAERLDTQRKADLENLTIRMSTLSSSLAGLRVPDLDSVKERLARIEAAVGSIAGPPPEVDLAPVMERLRQMETYLRSPSDELRILHTKLSDIEGGTASMHSKVSGIENTVGIIARSGVDLTPVQSRIAALESAIGAVRLELQSMPDFAPVERRLAALQESVLSLREPDLSPVVSTVRKLDARLDMGAVENRLTSIEYSLAAIHHMLRSRDGGYLRPEPDYAYRPPAYTPPTYEARSRDYEEIVEPLPPPPPARATTAKAPQRRTVQAVSDPIDAARRPGDRANLLTEAAFGSGDDLEEINGVGPMLGELLNEVGVYYFWQIAEWTPRDVEWVDEKLEHFKGRIERDNWVGQAKELARLPTSAQRPATE
ncbi:MAG: hypothetical protein R3C13_07470 [Hyphomonas sp.]|uniref:hypothetical protein n=1 Tax=Hyphomonas sp. TaxID=87 RepID=UPI0035284358